MSTSLTSNTLTFDGGSLGYSDIAKVNIGVDGFCQVLARDSSIGISRTCTLSKIGTIYAFSIGGTDSGQGGQVILYLNPSGTYEICGTQQNDKWCGIYGGRRSGGVSINNDVGGRTDHISGIILRVN